MNKTKRELILEIAATEGIEELTEREVALINDRLVAAYGRGGKASSAYIAGVLKEAGRSVRYADDFEEIADRHEEDLAGLLKFDTLAAAESSIHAINRKFREYQAEGNGEGVFHCRELAKRGRLRARLIAANDMVAAERRALNEEIAFWFDLWLRTPELFEDWIELRKSSPDFRRRFLEIGGLQSRGEPSDR